MSIGSNITRVRKERGYTQEQLAEMLGVTFQAVSSWERDEYRPEMDTFVRLTEALRVPSTAILEERSVTFNTRDAIYDWERMKTFVKATAKAAGMTNTLAAADFAVEAHEGVKRKNSDIPYVYHPLSMACHALAMGIRKDEIIAAILLHDVLEDCKDKGITEESLPVDERTREIVRLMTCEDSDDEDRKKQINDEYYSALAADPDAALVKCIDRCNNMTTMSWGLPRPSIYRKISETEEYYPALIKTLKDTQEYNDAAWLLKYQIESMLDIYKRLM